jgi:adenosylcobinamide kinase/adenosylcobinamide-phosphate guanylyltransferase
MTPGRLILVGGGARSGKSDFALTLARTLGKRRLFLATALAGDEEMAERIRRHRQTRGADFTTIEEPRAVPEVLAGQTGYHVVVLDCLTLWISNMLLEGMKSEAILERVDELVAVLGKSGMHAVLITNEVGMGLVPETPLGRVFRDVAGLAHQRLSKAADEVYFAVLGTMLRIKPAPALLQVQQ